MSGAAQPSEPPAPLLPAIPGQWARQEVDLGAVRVRLWVPCAPDALLDDAGVIERNRFNDTMPYWAWLWDSAPRLARLVVAAADLQGNALGVGGRSSAARFTPGTRVLELGAGLGLVGLAAGRLGCAVTLSDHDPLSLAALRVNVAENGIADARVWDLDWRALDAAPREVFEVVLGCDVVYEANAHEPILEALARFLVPGGEGWFADPGRTRLCSFVLRAEERGYTAEVRDESGTLTVGDSRFVPGMFRLVVLRRAP